MRDSIANLTRTIVPPLSTCDAELLHAAERARLGAYARYSEFAVGAAVRTTTGLLFVGCNVENAAYGLSMCAERVVLFAARAAGPVEIADMLIVAALPEPISPCGACRQVMLELAPHARVLLANLEHTVYETTPENLLPLAFSNGFLRASHTLPHKDRR